MKEKLRMKAAMFCVRNVGDTSASEALDILIRDHGNEVKVRILDCLRRCLECRVKPFCKIQLTIIEANDAETLVENTLRTVREII